MGHLTEKMCVVAVEAEKGKGGKGGREGEGLRDDDEKAP